ncbi:MAG: RsmF rRNA methyltransferase first C-terminal domain-containing protein [Fermentimonas sp.]|nr:RsmF rRNA methyltransferase first C-terminal domain-containing protein [Fermentimonas sp.]
MNFPDDFLNSIRPLLKDQTDLFLSALTEVPPVSVRLNPLKSESSHLEFQEVGERVPWSDWGYYLEKRPSFTFDPLFHSGMYYVQEASSMFIEYVVRQLFDKPVNCLDLCAAPGGKSVSLLSALPEGSFLTANEIIRQRSNILSENIIKHGYANTLVTNNEPKDFAVFENFFDLILIDAPCSGEGMFRKDEVAVREWSPENVVMCTARQKDILSDIWPALKPGGILIYSTCTYNTSENEVNALWAADELSAEFVEIDTESGWGISPSFDDNVKAYRFFPHKTKGEGLFVTVLRKEEFSVTNHDQYTQKRSRKNKKCPSQFVKETSVYRNYLINPDDFDFIQDKNRIIAIPKQHSAAMLTLKDSLKTVSIGIELGEIKGKDFIPSHSLAMSCELNRDAFVTRELTYDEAIAYLRREAINIPDAPKGFVLLTYKDKPLGFVKNIGNRANNLYPNEWRIRT